MEKTKKSGNQFTRKSKLPDAFEPMIIRHDSDITLSVMITENNKGTVAVQEIICLIRNIALTSNFSVMPFLQKTFCKAFIPLLAIAEPGGSIR